MGVVLRLLRKSLVQSLPRQVKTLYPALAGRHLLTSAGIWRLNANSRDFIAPDILNKYGREVSAGAHTLRRTRTTDAEGPPSLDGLRHIITSEQAVPLAIP